MNSSSSVGGGDIRQNHSGFMSRGFSGSQFGGDSEDIYFQQPNETYGNLSPRMMMTSRNPFEESMSPRLYFQNQQQNLGGSAS